MNALVLHLNYRVHYVCSLTEGALHPKSDSASVLKVAFGRRGIAKLFQLFLVKDLIKHYLKVILHLAYFETRSRYK